MFIMISTLAEEAKRLISNGYRRWLTAIELTKVMAYIQDCPCLMQKSLPYRPSCGSIVAIDYNLKKSKWKDDGYEYEKRANDRGFKEHSERIGDDKKVVCLYSSVSTGDDVYKNLEQHSSDAAEVKFQRRIYRLPDQFPELVLVHYFVSKKLRRPDEKGHEMSCEKLYFEFYLGTRMDQ